MTGNPTSNARDPCTHDVMYGKTCALCGKSMAAINKVFPLPDSVSMTFSEKEASRTALKNRALMIKNKKIPLVLRLETVLFDYVVCSSIDSAKELIPETMNEAYMMVMVPEIYVLKVRDYMQYFIERAAPLFDITVFTMLPKAVAMEFLEKVNPKQTFFPYRLLTRFHFDSPVQACEFHFFPATEEITLVIDSESATWKAKFDTIPSGFVYAPPIKCFEKDNVTSLSDRGMVPRVMKGPGDSFLAYLSDFMKVVYEDFYGDNLRSIFESVLSVRSSVLQGCCVCFASSVNKGETRDVEVLTTLMGGIFLSSYDPSTTHLIVSDTSDAEIQAAKEYHGVHIVGYEWFSDTCSFYKRMPESSYTVYGVKSPTEGLKEIAPPAIEGDFSMSDLGPVYDFSNSDALESAADEPAVFEIE